MRLYMRETPFIILITDLTIYHRFIQDLTGDQDKCKEKLFAMKAGITLVWGCLWRCH